MRIIRIMCTSRLEGRVAVEVGTGKSCGEQQDNEKEMMWEVVMRIERQQDGFIQRVG
jgi:hypothetical protein